MKRKTLDHTFDTVSSYNSAGSLNQVLVENAKLIMVLPEVRNDIAPSIEQSLIDDSLCKGLANETTRDNRRLGKIGIEREGKEFHPVFTKIIGKWMNKRKLKSHPVRGDCKGFGRGGLRKRR